MRLLASAMTMINIGADWKYDKDKNIRNRIPDSRCWPALHLSVSAWHKIDNGVRFRTEHWDHPCGQRRNIFEEGLIRLHFWNFRYSYALNKNYLLFFSKLAFARHCAAWLVTYMRQHYSAQYSSAVKIKIFRLNKNIWRITSDKSLATPLFIALLDEHLSHPSHNPVISIQVMGKCQHRLLNKKKYFRLRLYYEGCTRY